MAQLDPRIPMSVRLPSEGVMTPSEIAIRGMTVRELRRRAKEAEELAPLRRDQMIAQTEASRATAKAQVALERERLAAIERGDEEAARKLEDAEIQRAGELFARVPPNDPEAWQRAITAADELWGMPEPVLAQLRSVPHVTPEMQQQFQQLAVGTEKYLSMKETEQKNRHRDPIEVSPGASLYDPEAGESVFTAPGGKNTDLEETDQWLDLMSRMLGGERDETGWRLGRQTLIKKKIPAEFLEMIPEEFSAEAAADMRALGGERRAAQTRNFGGRVQQYDPRTDEWRDLGASESALNRQQRQELAELRTVQNQGELKPSQALAVIRLLLTEAREMRTGLDETLWDKSTSELQEIAAERHGFDLPALRRIAGGEGRASSRPAETSGGKQLDETTATEILREAGGDKEKARRIARERGYTF